MGCRDIAAIIGGTSPAQAGVVEQDDLSSGRERIGHGRIPVVERPGEVLQSNGSPEPPPNRRYA
jgi:hypothetical protein